MKKKTTKRRRSRILKLSDLILKGIKLDGKKIRNEFFQFRANKNGDGATRALVGCCALGAAKVAVAKAKRPGVNFKSMTPSDVVFLDRIRLPISKAMELATLPSKTQKKMGKLFPYWDGGDIPGVVMTLNDDKNWSRERIARFLKELGA